MALISRPLSPCPSRRRLVTAALALPGAALLGGCGLPVPHPREERDPGIQRFADRGYLAGGRYDTETVNDRWFDGREEIDLCLTLPRASAPHPLVIYLPGLGESARDGELWRTPWAAAGYAVLSLQPAVAGPAALAAGRARSGDFSGLSRHYAAEALARRAAAVRHVAAEIARRSGALQAPFERVDAARNALAGYDLGSQTAQHFAGERPRGGEAPAPLPGLKAAVFLSPWPGSAAGGLAERYGAMTVPSLSVTGPEDTDANGQITSAFSRQAPFRYMPAGDKYLLAVEDAGHRVFSGNPGGLRDDPGQEGDGMPAGGPRERGGGRGGPPGGGPGGGFGGGPDGPGASRGRAGGDGRRQAAAIASTSLAFLDAVLKEDPVAREWLARDANRWLDPLASLTAK